jgi:hypothetical protein
MPLMREAGFEMLSEQTDLEVIGDKASISAAKAAELWEQNRIRLRTLSRSKQKTQPSPVYQHIHKTIRQLIETVNGHNKEKMRVERHEGVSRLPPKKWYTCA